MRIINTKFYLTKSLKNNTYYYKYCKNRYYLLISYCNFI